MKEACGEKRIHLSAVIYRIFHTLPGDGLDEGIWQALNVSQKIGEIFIPVTLK